MNSTNRALNRVFLLVIGLALLAAGALGAGVAVLPRWARIWQHRAPVWHSELWSARQLGWSFAGVPSVPWFLFAVPLAAAILIAVLLIFALRQGRGHVPRAVDGRQLGDGPVRGMLSVDTALARDVIQHAARNARGIAEVGVTAYRVASTPALKVTVVVADGADPAAVLRDIERAVGEWDAVLGEPIPVFVQLVAGALAKVPAPVRAALPGRSEPSLLE